MAHWGEIIPECPRCGQRYIGSHACDPGLVVRGESDGYEPLRRVLDLALQQASGGKGAERHAMGKPFDRQPMLEISRMIGGPQGCMYQAMKKTQEASRMSPDAAKRELLGAINYLAGAYLLLEENETT